MSNIHRLSDLPPQRDVESSGVYWTRPYDSGGQNGARNSGEFLLLQSGRDSSSIRCIDMFFPGFTWKSVILWTSFAQIVVYTVMLFLGSRQLQPESHVLWRFGGSYGPSIQSGEVWRFITPMFLHASLWHLLLNVYFQLRMGFPLEATYGLPVMSLIYFVSGIGGTLFSVALAPCHLSVGASTAGFGLIGVQMAEMALAWHILTNKDQIIFNVATFILISVLFAANPGSVIDWRGHLGGFIAGFSLGVLFSKLETPPRWLKPMGRSLAGLVLGALFLACGLITFLIPMTGTRGRCA